MRIDVPRLLSPAWPVSCALALLLLTPADVLLAQSAATEPARAAPEHAPPATSPSSKPPGLDPALLARLDDPDWKVREAASHDAELLPPEALPLVEQTIASGDLSPEVSMRLEAIVPSLRRRAAASPYEKRVQAAMNWQRDLLLSAYSVAGHTNAAWDHTANDALVQCVRPYGDLKPTQNDNARIIAALEKAVALKCDDPLVKYLLIRRRIEAGSFARFHDAVDTISPIVQQIVEEKYPHWVQGCAVLNLMQTQLADDQYGFYPVEFDSMKANRAAFVRLLADPGDKLVVPRQELIRLALELQVVDASNHGFLRDPRHPLIDQIPRLVDDPVVKLIANGEYKKAWEADPTDPTAAVLMIERLDRIEAPIADLDTWFARATKADPSNHWAYHAKLKFLEHHADAEAIAAFAQECRATQDWPNRIPLLLVEAQEFLAEYRKDGPRNDHLSDPSVWSEVSRVMLDYLDRYPKDGHERSAFAALAWQTGHWEAGVTQVKILGDTIELEPFNGRAEFNYLRRKALAALSDDAGN